MSNVKKTNKNEKEQKPLWKRILKGFGVFYGAVIAFVAILSILAMIFSPMLASAMELEEEYYCEYCGDVFSSQKKWEKHITKCDVMLPPVEETTIVEITTVPEETTTETTVVETTTEETTIPETTTIVETTTEETTVAETTTVPEETTVVPEETTTVVENTTEKTTVPEKTTQETTAKPVETTTEPIVEATTSKPAVDEVTTRSNVDLPNITLPEIDWSEILENFSREESENEFYNEEVTFVTDTSAENTSKEDVFIEETLTEDTSSYLSDESQNVFLNEESEFPETGNPIPIAAFCALALAAVGVIATKKKSSKASEANA